MFPAQARCLQATLKLCCQGLELLDKVRQRHATVMSAKAFHLVTDNQMGIMIAVERGLGLASLNFRQEKEVMMGRIIGLGGEINEIRHRKKVVVDQCTECDKRLGSK